jgi:FMN phosphatase YigB (HAD superfamily)
MIDTLRAVLFDLDGTLLDNDMDVFVPRYFELLATRVAHILPAKDFVKHLMQATRAMLDNDGRDTNEEVFAAAFYPLVGHPRAELEPVFLDFYMHDFPGLQQYTQRRPEARRAVQAALDRGCDVVIATNPLFPAVAVEQRMAWAGVDGFPYRLVTTYENSRACKPNLLYFRHILETICQPAEACLVVGDEGLDMVAARLGCLTFYVGPTGRAMDPSIPAPTYYGSMAQVEALLSDSRPA